MLNTSLLLMGVVIIICVLLSRFTERLPVPSLLVFIGLGMLFGVNGPLGIYFDDYSMSENICSACLIFIMFYGGFGTNLRVAKPVAVRAFLLSSLGVAGTAGLVAVFAHFVLRLGWLESLLIGSVLSSTDAASVFNILRSQKFALKDNTASLLELESGSNDPMSYMLTVITVSAMLGNEVSVFKTLLAQIFLGAGIGIALGFLAAFLLNRFRFHFEQGNTILVFAVALVAYALPNLIGGNGYLSVYLCGIIMGNRFIVGKKHLVHFFDAITGIAQMMIFFLLGLLVTPIELPSVMIPAVCIMLFLTVIARPIVVSGILLPFRSSLRQICVVSWAGLRGVASIVFSIYAVLLHAPIRYNLFNLVFCVVFFSLAFQGALLPWISKKMQMIDNQTDVFKTFNDYQDDHEICFIKSHISDSHPFAHKKIRDIAMPNQFLAALIIREKKPIVPNGDHTLIPGDLLVIAAQPFENRENLSLLEKNVEKGHKWENHRLRDITMKNGSLIVMIKRDCQTIIPDGNTKIQADDTLVIAYF
ncbi:MAG: potassium/proton antiporter [Candidatus Merdivicinus sp.]